jgi:NAD(P)-dependent dehydrogenase (short-subunit alcohol dehydrogenase family)
VLSYKQISMAIQDQQSNLNGRRVVITGGTTGIGREIAIQLTRLSCNVIIAGRTEDHLQEAINAIELANPRGVCNGVLADLSGPEGIARLFEEVDSLFGSQFDVLINNAALAYGSVTEGNYNDWNEVISTNLLSYVACANEAIKRMKPFQNGHIVNIGSMSADVREDGSSVYVATKAGIQGFSESLRKEVNERGINVTLIEPGAVDTDMQPQTTQEKSEAVQRDEMLKAADIATAVIYVLSQDKRCDVVEIRLRPRMQLI